MKRILKFQIFDDKYAFCENETVVFEIDKTDLQFNVRTFYQVFFADDLDYSDIELQNMLTSDKNATRIFKCVEQLMKEVVEKLNKEMSVEDNHEKCPSTPFSTPLAKKLM